MTSHTIGTLREHLAARLDLLETEKQLARTSDELARRRRQPSWAPAGTDYYIDTDESDRHAARAVRRLPAAPLPLHVRPQYRRLDQGLPGLLPAAGTT
jgi:hypothetical protein